MKKKTAAAKKEVYRKPSKIKALRALLCKVHNFKAQYQSLL